MRIPRTTNSIFLSVEEELRFQRGLFLIVVFAYPGWGLIFGYLIPGVQDSISGRIFIAYLAFSLYLISRNASIPAVWTRTGFEFLSWILTAHYFQLFDRNQMHPAYLVGSFIVLTCVTVCLPTKRALLSYSGFSLFLSVLLTWKSQSEIKHLLLSGHLTVVSVAYVLLGSRLRMVSGWTQDHLLLKSVNEFQARFMGTEKSSEVFREMIENVVSLTKSEHGIIAEVLSDEQGKPFIKYLAFSTDGWVGPAKALYETWEKKGFEFRENKNLFGAILKQQTPVIANDPGRDLRAGGFPTGHPTISNFLGLPVFFNGELVGIVALGNRPGGFNYETVDYLRPLLGAAGALIGALRSERREKEGQIQREASRQSLVAASKLSSLGEMAGGIAHEINNPLAIIEGRVSQLERLLGEKKVQRKEAKRLLVNIRTTSQRIVAIVKGLLVFSGSGARDEMAPVDLWGLVENTLGLCGERFRHQGVSLRLKKSEVEAIVMGRQVQLSQVFLNLLNNAFDAVVTLTDPWIEIALEVEPEKVVVSVTDSGAGIPVAVREKIFDPFFTTKDIGKGTGLGLSISMGIIKDHGGSLTLDERSPHTRFQVSFPNAATGLKEEKKAA